jgi:hypothetical protein
VREGKGEERQMGGGFLLLTWISAALNLQREPGDRYLQRDVFFSCVFARKVDARCNEDAERVNGGRGTGPETNNEQPNDAKKPQPRFGKNIKKTPKGSKGSLVAGYRE